MIYPEASKAMTFNLVVVPVPPTSLSVPTPVKTPITSEKSYIFHYNM